MPYYIYEGGNLRPFEVTLDTGETMAAYVDPSNQYSADGACWRSADTNEFISKYRVVAFRPLDDEPVFPSDKERNKS